MCKHYAATYSGGVCSVRNQYGQAVPVVQAVCARCASCVRKRVCKQKCVQVCCRVNFILFCVCDACAGGASSCNCKPSNLLRIADILSHRRRSLSRSKCASAQSPYVRGASSLPYIFPVTLRTCDRPSAPMGAGSPTGGRAYIVVVDSPWRKAASMSVVTRISSNCAAVAAKRCA